MFDPEDYRHLKENFIKSFEKKKLNLDMILEYSNMSGVPLIALYTYVKEDYPEMENCCKEKINRLKKFYGIKIEKTCGTCDKPCRNEHCITKLE